MTYYDWICDDCEEIWEQDHPLGTAPKQTECPKCGELRNRNWGSVTNFEIKGESHTQRVRRRKFYKDGLDKDTAEEFYKDAIAGTKKRANEGWKQYSKITPNYENFKKIGAARVRSDKETSKVIENAKKLTRDCYNGVGRDPANLDFDKPQ